MLSLKKRKKEPRETKSLANNLISDKTVSRNKRALFLKDLEYKNSTH